MRRLLLTQNQTVDDAVDGEWAATSVKGIYVALTTPEKLSVDGHSFKIDEKGLRADIDLACDVLEVES
jgi:hypothetical protein